ncbi:peptidoglycan binding domain-containing protein [Eubacterium multiforme]|uniref:L,D-TPase catalytic domain-containing protein n=1 Tax=Eubacterium multiforme TaxID=83339 RepID=A0ABT9UX78_9FIRM|nr:peptidoglycan binding domain-containing protein [Eubacterium multiforme]MDQ0150914.1 hypothetical protein [Eubacterium multiforme]
MRKKNRTRKVMIGVIVSFCILIVIYFGMSIYFKSHFYFGTKINSISVSGKTVEEAKEKMLSEASLYKLELEGRENMKGEINASNINLKYDLNEELYKLKDNENPFAWIIKVFTSKDYKLSKVVSYDENLLKKSLNNLSFFNEDNVVKPENPKFKYKDKSYEVIDEVIGNKVNKDILYKNVSNAIINGDKKLNLEEKNCYENPKYTSGSDEVKKVKENLNKYVSTEVTYIVPNNKEVLNGDTINKWLKVDKNLKIKFDDKEIKNYVDSLARKYNTFGKTRDFKTSLGTTVQVTGGNYGFAIDTSEEVKDLIENIKKGETISKEPNYLQTALSTNVNDIGNTYVEINLTKQHMWFYKDGKLMTNGQIVTGDVSKNYGTPAGIYRLTYKQRNATLRGENYETPVSFWMPFNGGIGIHDAVWRGSFGGSIYRTNGSHGCINTPYNVAQIIFNNIEEGTPVICYF